MTAGVHDEKGLTLRDDPTSKEAADLVRLLLRERIVPAKLCPLTFEERENSRCFQGNKTTQKTSSFNIKCRRRFAFRPVSSFFSNIRRSPSTFHGMEEKSFVFFSFDFRATKTAFY